MSAPLKVMLVRKKKNELGGWVHAAPYRAARSVRDKDLPPEPGVLETLLRKVAPSGWVVVNSKTWMSLVKLKKTSAEQGDALNLAKAILHAKEQQCDVLVFSRDRDGAKNRSRQVEIDAMVTNASTDAGTLQVVGAVAVETLEAWVLAFAGDAKCESHTSPSDVLCALRDIAPKDTSAMVAIIDDEKVDLAAAAARSPSLARWVGHARRVFAPA